MAPEMDPHDPRNDVTTAVRAISKSAPTTGPLPSTPLGRLVCVLGHETGRSFSLGSRSVVIGRGTDADICLSGDDISRHHACVSWEAGRFVLDDLRSSNGTSVNGIPVKRHVLRVGDQIQLAESATVVFTRYDRLEQRAMQLQKLETLGQLAGGLAHDFGNAVNVILGTVDVLERHATRVGQVDVQELMAALAAIRQAATAAGGITQRILCFARSDASIGTAPTLLAPIVHEVADLAGRTTQQPIEVRVDVDRHVKVRADRTALGQALMNLFVNARDAMPTGGRLTVRGRRVELGRHEAVEHHLPAEGAFVELEVSDTGIGMDEATRARIFEPFFTTKPEGSGTGLGLFSVFGIVRALGGSITVDSEVGRGTAFELLLPAA